MLERSAVADRVCDRVYLAGYRADGDAWIPTFDALVAPSRTEGQGVAVLEAFRAGVPVVASDIPPFRALIEPGVTGWLCDPDDTVDVTRAIRTVVGLELADRRRVCRTARSLFERDYSLDAMIRGYDRVYAQASQALSRRNLRTVILAG
jgi:glycosyltransferase involved in cell wall biosynthesis